MPILKENVVVFVPQVLPAQQQHYNRQPQAHHIRHMYYIEQHRGKPTFCVCLTTPKATSF